MSAVVPQPQSAVTPPAPTTGYGAGKKSQAALGAHAAWKQPIKDVRPKDVIEVAVSLERMRRRTPIVWVQSAGVGIAGAGLGALLGSGASTLAWVALAGGGALAAGLQFALHDRAVNVSNVCAEFLRFVDQWPPMGVHTHSKNSEYVRAIVTEENPSVRTRWQQWRKNEAA